MYSYKKVNEKQPTYETANLTLLQDTVLSTAASLMAVLLVRWLSEPVPGFTTLVLAYVGIAAAATVAGSLMSGSHRVVRRWATFSSSSRLIQTVLTKEAVLLVAILLGLFRQFSPALSVLALLADSVLTLLALLYIRFAARLFSKSEVNRVKQEAARKTALVAGTDAAAVSFARDLAREGVFEVIGYISPDPEMTGRVLGNVAVYFCATEKDLELLQWKLGGVDCIFLPPVKEMPDAGSSGSSEDAAASHASEYVRDGMSRAGQIIKRSFDLLLSALLILIFLPLALICALAVKLEDGGPVFYRQERIGRNGKPFSILKFRSMHTDAEANGEQLFGGDGDPRLTRVGAFLRRHHLDELPQLWNVLCGDMSFIGYRPERQHFIDQIMEHNPRYCYLYQIRPGVTSYATLYNGYTDTLEKMLTRLDLDLYYLRHHSVLFDARVLALTFLRIVSGKKF